MTSANAGLLAAFTIFFMSIKQEVTGQFIQILMGAVHCSCPLGQVSERVHVMNRSSKTSLGFAQ